MSPTRPQHSVVGQPVHDPRVLSQRGNLICHLHLFRYSNAKTTQRYAHLAPGALIEAANIVGDLVQAKPRVAAA